MIQILTGDALRVLRGMEAGGFHCCICSPPYWGLRDYGVAGQLGLEEDFEEYLEKLVAIFDEVKRVLRSDGVAFVNMGDCYAAGKCGRDDDGPADLARRAAKYSTGVLKAGVKGANGVARKATGGLKPKDLVGQPWRLAFALRDAGWYLRSEIIWHKPNPMPESVDSRPTKSHEQIFLLAKSAKYFYDAEAIREPHQMAATSHEGQAINGYQCPERADGRTGMPRRPDLFNPAGRNKRTVWTVPSHAFSEAHFATFPPDLIIPCVKAGTSERGCCPVCGAGWKREVEATGGTIGTDKAAWKECRTEGGSWSTPADVRALQKTYRRKDLGFRPTCEHGRDPVPCRVLDPFFGAGTTGLVADRLGRDCTGIELNPAYSAMAAKRLMADSPMFMKVEVVK